MKILKVALQLSTWDLFPERSVSGRLPNVRSLLGNFYCRFDNLIVELQRFLKRV